MKISACYIVRDEAAVLERSICSLREAVDEIIVVDTGSIDGTMEIAQKYASFVYQYPWQQDFAAARNFALEQVHGDWIIFLDADEYFSEETAKNLRFVVEHSTAEALGINIINYDKDNEKVLVAFFALRAFKRQADICYVGRIHEQLEKNGVPLERIFFVAPQQLSIIHTGYSAGISRKKAERNLDLLQKELADGKPPEQLYMYLAETYDGLGDSKKAMQNARRDIALGRQPISYASRSYRILLRLLAEKAANSPERLQVAAKAVEEFPELPEFHAEYAECLAYSLRHEEAMQEMQQAIASCENYRGLEPMTFSAESCEAVKKRLEVWRHIENEKQKLQISVCAIAKNEAAEVGFWLEQAKIYSDEIIFMDTGSTDNTVEIVQQAGVPVYHFPWGNDFSQARNAALEKAKGKWVIFLDVDEYFAVPEKIRNFLAEISITSKAVEAIAVTIANIDADVHNMEIQRFQAIRIFRNLPQLRYGGTVHENLYKTDGTMDLLLAGERLLLYHTGYSSARIRTKVKRNFALLQQDIALKGEGPEHYRYLADCYLAMQDYEKALHYAELAIESPLQAVGSESDHYRWALEAMQHLKRSLSDQPAMAKAAIEKFPLLPDFYGSKGIILYEQGKFAAAEASLEKAVELYEKPKNPVGEASSFEGRAAEAYWRLGVLADREGKEQEAGEYMQRALQCNRYNEAALTAFYEVCGEHRDKFVQGIADIYEDNQQDLQFLSEWAEKAGAFSVYEYYMNQLEQIFQKGNSLQSFYALAKKADFAALYEQSLPETATRLQQLFVELVKLILQKDDVDMVFVEKKMLLQPKSMAAILQRLQGKKKWLEEETWEGYTAILPMVSRWAEEKELAAFAQLVLDYSAEKVFHAANQFYALEKWEIAFGLYEKISAGESVVTADFWHHAGVCCYYLRQWETAAACLQQAMEHGYTGKDIQAYLQWMAERQE